MDVRLAPNDSPQNECILPVEYRAGKVQNRTKRVDHVYEISEFSVHRMTDDNADSGSLSAFTN